MRRRLATDGRNDATAAVCAALRRRIAVAHGALSREARRSLRRRRRQRSLWSAARVSFFWRSLVSNTLRASGDQLSRRGAQAVACSRRRRLDSRGTHNARRRCCVSVFLTSQSWQRVLVATFCHRIRESVERVLRQYRHHFRHNEPDGSVVVDRRNSKLKVVTQRAVVVARDSPRDVIIACRRARRFVECVSFLLLFCESALRPT